MVPRENKTNAYAKFRETKKEYYGIFQNDQLPVYFPYSRLVYAKPIDCSKFKDMLQITKEPTKKSTD